MTVDYPEQHAAGRARARPIVICEDTDGDGVADKFTVFADKLSIPTSLAFANGGVIVTRRRTRCSSRTPTATTRPTCARCCSPAGAPATRTPGRAICGTAWTTGSTASSATRGFNGTVAGEQVRFGQGFYRFKLERTKTDGVSDEARVPPRHQQQLLGRRLQRGGLLFGSTANGCPSVYLPIPNRYYEKVRGWSSSVLEPIAIRNVERHT